MTVELGQRVKFTHVINRETHVERDGKRGIFRVWDASPAAGEGVVYGIRTLSNGKVEIEREHDGYFGSVYTHTTYFPTEHFAAYLVATDLRHKPITVKVEHAEVIES